MRTSYLNLFILIVGILNQNMEAAPLLDICLGIKNALELGCACGIVLGYFVGCSKSNMPSLCCMLTTNSSTG